MPALVTVSVSASPPRCLTWNHAHPLRRRRGAGRPVLARPRIRQCRRSLRSSPAGASQDCDSRPRDPTGCDARALPLAEVWRFTRCRELQPALYVPSPGRKFAQQSKAWPVRDAHQTTVRVVADRVRHGRRAGHRATARRTSGMTPETHTAAVHCAVARDRLELARSSLPGSVYLSCAPRVPPSLSPSPTRRFTGGHERPLCGGDAAARSRSHARPAHERDTSGRPATPRSAEKTRDRAHRSAPADRGRPAADRWKSTPLVSRGTHRASRAIGAGACRLLKVAPQARSGRRSGRSPPRLRARALASPQGSRLDRIPQQPPSEAYRFTVTLSIMCPICHVRAAFHVGAVTDPSPRADQQPADGRTDAGDCPSPPAPCPLVPSARSRRRGARPPRPKLAVPDVCRYRTGTGPFGCVPAGNLCRGSFSLERSLYPEAAIETRTASTPDLPGSRGAVDRADVVNRHELVLSRRSTMPIRSAGCSQSGDETARRPVTI